MGEVIEGVLYGMKRYNREGELMTETRRASDEELKRLEVSSRLLGKSYWDLCNPSPEMITIEKQELQAIKDGARYDLQVQSRHYESRYDALEFDFKRLKNLTLIQYSHIS